MQSKQDVGPGEVTRLLRASRQGERDALEQLIPLVYDELRQLARRQLRREYASRTIEPTTLVHEAYLKLAGGGAVEAADRGHFLAIAGRAMRQVLVDQARRRSAARRGGDHWRATTLQDGLRAMDVDPDELLALDEALEQLEERQRRIVECRYFAGMDEAEIAAMLGISERTVRREWVKARAWLYRLLYVKPSP
jgi:RNA polymerase sigma-70 factor (ECF subfamily)